MLFNNRRQSRDSAVLADIGSLVGSERLLCSPFSERMLADAGLSHISSERFLDIAEKGDFCFVENAALSEFLPRIEKIIIYNWNRHYPSDFRLDINPEKSGFKLTGRYDFSGTSHEKITREIFEK